MSLRITPIGLDEANAFVTVHHRHHRPVPGAKFCLAAAAGDTVHGVAIVGRPVARGSDDGWTLDAARLAWQGRRTQLEHAISSTHRYLRTAARPETAVGGHMLTAKLKFENPADLKASITFTMTLREWVEFRDSLAEKRTVAQNWRVLGAIEQLVGQAQHAFMATEPTDLQP
jgi:hypothetical protein